MNNIRKVIRKLINEIFDNINLPEDLVEEGENRYVFKLGNYKYWIKFEEFKKTSLNSISDESVLKKINSSDNKYFVNFGVVINGRNDSEIDTNEGDVIKVLVSIAGIIDFFIKKNNVKVLTFFPISEKRKRVYLKVAENLKNDNFRILNYYKSYNSNIFLVLNEIIENE